MLSQKCKRRSLTSAVKSMLLWSISRHPQSNSKMISTTCLNDCKVLRSWQRKPRVTLTSPKSSMKQIGRESRRIKMISRRLRVNSKMLPLQADLIQHSPISKKSKSQRKAVRNCSHTSSSLTSLKVTTWGKATTYSWPGVMPCKSNLIRCQPEWNLLQPDLAEVDLPFPTSVMMTLTGGIIQRRNANSSKTS